jgi:hypothetical protein
MTVTPYMEALEVEAMATGIHRRGSNDTFGEEGQTLGSLKGGSRRILAHDTTVEQGFPHIL